MLTGCDLISLETKARDHIAEPSPRQWLQANVFRAINDIYGSLCLDVVQADVGYFDTTSETTLTSKTVTLPRNCAVIRDFAVYRDSKYHPVTPIGAHELYKVRLPDDTTAYVQAIRFEGNTVVLEPGYANITKLKIWYTRIPAELVYQTMGAFVDATTMQMASASSVFDDIYIGDEFETLAGTGSGQWGTISDYTGSNQRATVGTWGTNPDATTTFSLLLANPVNRYPHLVTIGAAIELLDRRRDANMISILQGRYDRGYDKFLNTLRPRQTDRAQYGNYIPRLED